MWRHTGNERKTGALAQGAKCATALIRHLCQVKTLTTRACLKHSDFQKIDNGIETAVHMKPFSVKERIRHRDRLTRIQLTQRRSSVRNSPPGTTHPDDPSLQHTYTPASRHSSRIRFPGDALVHTSAGFIAVPTFSSSSFPSTRASCSQSPLRPTCFDAALWPRRRE